MWKRMMMLFVAAATAFGMLPAIAAASPPTVYGEWHYAWGSLPNVASYEPGTTFSRNPSGDGLTITRLGEGTYRATFDGADFDDGTVQVSGYSTSAHCNTSGWGGASINVRCVDPAGAPTDARFTVLHTDSDDEAYVYANRPGEATYAAPTSYSNNPSGGAINVFRTAEGRYRVNFAGYSVGGHNVQVTSYNTTAHCNAPGWGSGNVRVTCYDASGTPVDAPFTMLATAADDASYAWVGNPATDSTPSAVFANNPAGGAVTVDHTNTGRYSVLFPNGPLSNGNVQITAYNSSAVCNSAGWNDTSLRVRCYDAAGAFVDSRFSVLHVDPTLFLLPPLFLTCDGHVVTVNIGNGDVPTEGADVILGTPGDDFIDGLGGDDIICGLAGDDTLRGSKGADRILGGDGNDILRGMGGADAIFGEAGSDRLIGNHRNDLMMGGDGNDFLLGGAGRDRGRGEAGNDTLNGGPGPDKLWGDAGDDIVKGQTGNDDLFGGGGADRLIGGLGVNTLEGGAGPDTCRPDNDSPPEAC